MVLALVAAAFHCGFVVLRATAALTIFAATILLALSHGGLHFFVLVHAFTAGFPVFRGAFVFAAAFHGFLGIGGAVMATALAVFHVGHVVVAAALGFRSVG